MPVHVDDDSAAFTDLISAVKAAVRAANRAGLGLTVTELTLTAVVTATRASGAGIELRVPVVGARFGARKTYTDRRTQTVEITLVPPAAAGFEVRSSAAEQALLNALTTVQAALTAAAAGDDPFVLKSSVVALDFVITESGSVQIVGEGGLDDEVTHRLSVTLGPVG